MVRTQPYSTYPNLMCIWCHDKYITKDVFRQINIQIHQNFSYARTFDNKDDLIHYIKEPVIPHIVFIISIKDEKIKQAIQKCIKRRPKCRKSYELSLQNYESSPLPMSASVRSTLKEKFDRIIDELRRDGCLSSTNDGTPDNEAYTTDEPTLAFDTFRSISTDRSFCDLDKQGLRFLLFQSLIEALLHIPYTKEDFTHMWNACCADFTLHPMDVENLRRIESEYNSQQAIYYYTQPSSCLFRLINRAFRMEDVERIYRFGCYIADLHHELKTLSDEQNTDGHSCRKTLYRGKRYSSEVLQQFKDHVGHFISIHGLLSTTKCCDVANLFAGMEAPDDGYHRVVFEINVNSTATPLVRPYANVRQFSANKDEDEFLFFMGFVWKLESIEEMTENRWYIKLQLCTDYVPETVKYIKEARRECNYLTIGDILHELGDYANAMNFYLRMESKPNLDPKTHSRIYYNMALVADDEGAYLLALYWLKEAQKHIESITTNENKTLFRPRPLFKSDIDGTRLHILNNMGRCYLTEGNYQLAEDNFRRALEEHGSDVDRAAVLNNYGILEYYRENLNEARTYLEKAVNLAKDDACVSEFNRNLDAVVARI